MLETWTGNWSFRWNRAAFWVLETSQFFRVLLLVVRWIVITIRVPKNWTRYFIQPSDFWSICSNGKSAMASKISSWFKSYLPVTLHSPIESRFSMAAVRSWKWSPRRPGRVTPWSTVRIWRLSSRSAELWRGATFGDLWGKCSWWLNSFCLLILSFRWLQLNSAISEVSLIDLHQPAASAIPQDYTRLTARVTTMTLDDWAEFCDPRSSKLQDFQILLVYGDDNGYSV